MNTSENNSPEFQESFEEQGEFLNKIKEWLFLCLHKWYWFVVCVIVCSVLAQVKIMRTSPVYTHTAKVIIKSNEVSSTLSNMGNEFESIDKVGLQLDLQDEITSMQAIDVIAEVVRSLHLDMNYSVPGIWRSEVLYDASLPVTTNILDIDDNSSASFSIKLENGEAVLSDFVLNGAALSGNIKCKIANVIETPVGKMAVMPTTYYNRNASYPKIDVNRSPIIATVHEYRGKLSIYKTGTRIVDITVEDYSPKRADDFISTLIAVNNGNWIKDKNQVMVSTSLFINDRLQVIERELGNVESDISDYKSANLMPSVDVVTGQNFGKSTATNDIIFDLNNQLSVAHFIRNLVVNTASKNQLIPVNSGIDNPVVSEQINNYNTLMLRRNNLVANSSEQNPLIVDMDRQLLELKAVVINAIDNHIMTLKQQLSAYGGLEREANARLAANPQQAKFLLSIERQQKVKESLYLFLLQKREENELSQAFTAYNTRIVEQPNGSNSPTSPKKRKIRMMALLIGFAFPAVIIICFELLNTSVRSRRDLEKLSIPFLGEIPYAFNIKDIKKKKKKDKKELENQSDSSSKKEDFDSGVVVKHGSRNYVNEAFRVLRSNIDFMKDNKSSHVIMFTSYNPSSGKSFITANLAVTMAIKDIKVVVLDCDLRHASLSGFVPKTRVGLANYLAGKVEDYHQVCVCSEKYHSLTIFPVGSIPPNPTELLDNARFGALIRQLREEYDYVLLDCPPVDIIADASLIARHVDQTAFVVRANLMERSLLSDLEVLYKRNSYPNLSVILNGTVEENNYYSHRYNYKYGYKYGYHSHNYYQEEDEESASGEEMKS